jgi:hypothetical protein
MAAQLLALIPAIGQILNKIIPDPNERTRIQAELAKEMLNAEGEFYKAAGSIITAEAKGESWMQRNWRPVTMLTFVFIIANNYILVPYIQFMSGLFGANLLVPTLDIPEGLWGLLQIGIGGYIASRGVEKTVQTVQQGGTPLFSAQPKNAVTKEDLERDRHKLLDELRGA